MGSKVTRSRTEMVSGIMVFLRDLTHDKLSIALCHLIQSTPGQYDVTENYSLETKLTSLPDSTLEDLYDVMKELDALLNKEACL